MANGRLGSAKLTPVSAALLYSNTSGSQAVINVQATALSSTTNANMALSVADRGYVLQTGRIVLEGKASDLAGHDELRRAYLGR